MPLFHTSGCGMVTLGCLTSKCRMILTSFFDPEKIYRPTDKDFGLQKELKMLMYSGIEKKNVANFEVI